MGRRLLCRGLSEGADEWKCHYYLRLHPPHRTQRLLVHQSAGVARGEPYRRHAGWLERQSRLSAFPDRYSLRHGADTSQFSSAAQKRYELHRRGDLGGECGPPFGLFAILAPGFDLKTLIELRGGEGLPRVEARFE